MEPYEEVIEWPKNLTMEKNIWAIVGFVNKELAKRVESYQEIELKAVVLEQRTFIYKITQQ